jgi:short chain dehydrogenase
MATLWAAAARQPNSARVDFSEAYDVAGLKGRSALITGGATGIGGGIVRGLAEAGVYVTIADLNDKDGEPLAEELKGNGYRYVLFDFVARGIYVHLIA